MSATSAVTALFNSNTVNPNEPYWIAGQPDGASTLLRLYGWTQGLGYYCNCTNRQYNSFQSTITIRA